MHARKAENDKRRGYYLGNGDPWVRKLCSFNESLFKQIQRGNWQFPNLKIGHKT
jgi:hypothetical protein